RVRAAHLATLTVVGGTCASRCAAAPARAALSLARRLGGWALDICDPVSVSQRIGVASLASAFAPIWGYLLSFPRLPIPASLAVRHDGQDLARSRVDGFDYRRSNNSLALTVARRHGDRFHAAYSYWTNGELAADGGSAARQ
ncbi:MAG: hypothetical protein KC503_03345, partial [Myxococcales bacterium]|nr:hypothetical protein [Myxococcales bacterium]